MNDDNVIRFRPANDTAAPHASAERSAALSALEWALRATGRVALFLTRATLITLRAVAFFALVWVQPIASRLFGAVATLFLLSAAVIFLGMEAGAQKTTLLIFACGGGVGSIVLLSFYDAIVDALRPARRPKNATVTTLHDQAA